MDAAALYRLIDDPSGLNADTLSGLASVVKEFPYFQAARMLYLKNLSMLSDSGFESELRRCSIMVADRKRLYRLIEGDKYFNFAISHESKDNGNDSFSLIDAFLSDHDEGGSDKHVDNPLLFQPSASSDYLFWSLSSKEESTDADDENRRLQGHDLIDSFIESEQQRLPGSGFPSREEALEAGMPESIRELDDDKRNQSLEDSCLTETLARIYIKQRRYEKALQIIKNLSLKYPEKNVYFADQIRFLEKLIINTKK